MYDCETASQLCLMQHPPVHAYAGKIKIWDPTAFSMFTCLELLFRKKISHDIYPKRKKRREKKRNKTSRMTYRMEYGMGKVLDQNQGEAN